MARDVEIYDSALLGILRQEENIENFLNVIHGFLLRKTDFFIVKKRDDDRMGFPSGKAFDILQNSFRKFETLAAQLSQEAEARRRAVEEKEKKKKQNMPASKENAPTEAKKAAVEPLRGEGGQAAAAASDKSNGAAAEPSSVELPSKTPQPSGQSNHPSGQSSSADQAPAPKSSDAPASNASKEGDAAAESKAKDQDRSRSGEGEEEEDPQVAAERRALQANPETYNGADRDSYRWSQSITEVDVYVKVPEGIRKGSMVQVTSGRKHLKVAVMGPDRQWQVLVDGELTWEIKSDACWTLEPSRRVHIALEKREERWWEALLVGEPKINTRKIDCSRPMTDLDDEAQAKIDELMFNQRQKELGLPQSHEQKTYKILQEAWNAPGSPFAGRPFDPSLVSVDPNGIVNMK